MQAYRVLRIIDKKMRNGHAYIRSTIDKGKNARTDQKIKQWGNGNGRIEWCFAWKMISTYHHRISTLPMTESGPDFLINCLQLKLWEIAPIVVMCGPKIRLVKGERMRRFNGHIYSRQNRMRISYSFIFIFLSGLYLIPSLWWWPFRWNGAIIRTEHKDIIVSKRSYA